MIFDQRNGNTVFFKVLVKPLVNLIWVAGIVFVLGSLVALWPDAREQRRLVARLALAAVMTAALVRGRARRGRGGRARRAPVPARAGSPTDDRLDAPTEAEERRLALIEERDRALAALKELEFDHRTGQDRRRGLPRASSARSGARPPRRCGRWTTAAAGASAPSGGESTHA